MARRKDSKRGRWYEVDAPDGPVELPSVTNIEGAVAKPALMNWAAKVEREMVIQAAADFYEDTIKTPPMSRSAYTMSLTERIGKLRQHQREMEKAQSIGTEAHSLIEWHLHRRMNAEVGPEPKVSEPALWAYMAWDDWQRSVDLLPLHVENTVWSLEYGYAGTMDLHCMIRGVETVCDWKSGKQVYLTEAGMQNAAYRHALREMGHGDPKQGLIVRLPKVTTDPEFEVVNVDEQVAKLVGLIGPHMAESYLFQKFLATYELWKWVQVNDDAYWEKKKE